MIFVVNNTEPVPEDAIVINTTSRSTNWSRGFSPFFLPGGHLYGNYYAKNVENAWQYAKVYPQHINPDGSIKPEYFKWAKRGWECEYAHRYPMGKEKNPLFSLWGEERLGYIEARKKIYLPTYCRAVVKTEAFAKLKEIYNTTKQDIYLRDFDGYNHIKKKMTFRDVLYNESKSMGHAFAIWYLITEGY